MPQLEVRRALRELAREPKFGARLFDHASATPLERRHYHTWQRDGCELVDIHHPNAEGYKLQAEAFARHLIGEQLVDRRSIGGDPNYR